MSVIMLALAANLLAAALLAFTIFFYAVVYVGLAVVARETGVAVAVVTRNIINTESLPVTRAIHTVINVGFTQSTRVAVQTNAIVAINTVVTATEPTRIRVTFIDVCFAMRARVSGCAPARV